MGTWAQIKIKDGNDGIYLQTSSDGYLDYVLPKIYKTEKNLDETISLIKEKLLILEDKNPSKRFISEFLDSLISFQSQKMNAQKMANLVVWGNPTTFYPASSYTTLFNSESYISNKADFYLSEVNGKFELELPFKLESKKSQDNPSYDFNSYKQYLNNAPVVKQKKEPSLKEYTAKPISDEYAIIQILDSDEWNLEKHALDDLGDEDNENPVHDFKKTPLNVGSFVKMKKSKIHLLPEIVANLPFKLASLINFWSFGLDDVLRKNEEEKSKKKSKKTKDGTQEKSFLPWVQGTLSFLSNFQYYDDTEINDFKKLSFFSRFQVANITGYNIYNYLVLFHPDLFETTTVGEIKFIKQEKSTINAWIYSDNAIMLCLEDKTSQEMADLCLEIDKKSVQTFKDFAEYWNVEPLLVLSPEFIENINTTEYNKILFTRGEVSENPKEKTISLGYSPIYSNYQLFRLYDVSSIKRLNFQPKKNQD